MNADTVWRAVSRRARVRLHSHGLVPVGQILAFHAGDLAPVDDDPALLWFRISLNHRSNTSPWHEEDLARRLDVPDSEIVANQRAIDRYNQIRNDAVERIDEHLLRKLAIAVQRPRRSLGHVSGGHHRRCAQASARQHSETPGSMIDRLSILSLKMRAMAAQVARTDVPVGHAVACAAKLQRLRDQRSDLACCLQALFADVRASRCIASSSCTTIRQPTRRCMPGGPTNLQSLRSPISHSSKTP